MGGELHEFSKSTMSALQSLATDLSPDKKRKPASGNEDVVIRAGEAPLTQTKLHELFIKKATCLKRTDARSSTLRSMFLLPGARGFANICIGRADKLEAKM